MRIDFFRFYATGIVVEDKDPDRHTVKVVPVELFPLVDDILTDNIDLTETKGLDAKEREYTVRLKTTVAIEATWLPMGTNRVTSPDLMRGERVFLYKYADAETIYWTPAGLDDHLRRLETVIFGIAAEPELGVELEPLKNMYIMEMSSHAKHISLRTSKAFDEPSTLLFQFNTATGVVTLTDEEAMRLEMDFPNDKITAINAAESYVILDKDIITGHAKKYIKIEAPKMQYGDDGSSQPSTLGDNQAEAYLKLETQLNNAFNGLGAGRPIDVPELRSGGKVYSKKNKNQ